MGANKAKILFEKYLDKLLNLRMVRIAHIWSRKIILPGFDGMPLFDVLVFFIKGIQKGYITLRASSIAYSFFLSLFPAILFFFTLIPFIPITNFQDELFNLMKQVIPASIFPMVESTLFDIIKRPHRGFLSIGFLMTLYFSTNGVSSLIQGFNATYYSIETRTWFKQKVTSILLVLVISVLIVVSIGLIILGTSTLNQMVEKGVLQTNVSYYLIYFGRWIVIIALFFFMISFLYYLGPSKKEKFRFISAGSSLATLLVLIISLGFNFYISNFSRYNTLYGSIGTLIVFLLWIYFNSIILLIGFELNASISHASKEAKLHNQA